jgi:Fe-S cluster biogenesis protein NfuA
VVKSKFNPAVCRRCGEVKVVREFEGEVPSEFAVYQGLCKTCSWEVKHASESK